MKFLFAYIIFTALLISTMANQCNWKQIANCFRKMDLINNPELTYPKNDTEIQNLCNELHRSQQCINTFGNKCLKFPLSVILLNNIDLGLRSYNQNICFDDEAKFFLKKSLQCYSKQVNKDMLMSLNKKFVKMLELIPHYHKAKRTDAACYCILMFKGAVWGYLLEACGQEDGEHINKYIQKVYNQPLHRLCPRESPDWIYKFDKKIKKDFEDVLEGDKLPKTIHDFPVPTILDLAKDIFD